MPEEVSSICCFPAAIKAEERQARADEAAPDSTLLPFEQMQAGAIEIAIEAQDKHEIEKDVSSLCFQAARRARARELNRSRTTQIAAQIKKEADKRWGPTWHVVVGKSFGSYVTHTVSRAYRPSPRCERPALTLVALRAPSLATSFTCTSISLLS